MKEKALVAGLLALLVAGLFMIHGAIQDATALKQEERDQLIQQLEELTREQHRLMEEKNELLRRIKERDDLERRMNEWLDKFEARRVTVTAYAPLDPKAVRGVCYSGDPNVTASGQPPIPGQTAAGGRAYAFGDTVWIEGIGARLINDRGGRVPGYNIDVMMATRKDAYTFGRQELWVVYKKTS